MRRRITLLATLCVAIFATPAAAAGPLQPGDLHETSVGFCTLNFAFSGPGGTHFGTAAHCVASIGEDVRDADGDVFGDVSFIANDANTETDFAFIKVRSGWTVNPAVRGHASYPTGVTAFGETVAGDRLQISGHGIGFGFLALTRERRQAVLTFDNAERWHAAGPLINGDSGGPIVHIRTGKALGMESRVCIDICTDEGPTVQGIVAKAGAAGFPVSLQTAP